MWINYIVTECKPRSRATPTFIIKLDDDVILNTFEAVELIRKDKDSLQTSIICRVATNHLIDRNSENRW